MPPREWRVRLGDIVEAAERASAYVQGLTFEQFAADPRTVDAVSYAIVVIGETSPDPYSTSAGTRPPPRPSSSPAHAGAVTSPTPWAPRQGQ